MQVDPVKPMLKPPGTKHLKLKCDMLLSTFAFKINLRRYDKARLEGELGAAHGRAVQIDPRLTSD